MLLVPIAKTVSDVEIIFNIIKGKDELDSTSISQNHKISKSQNQEEKTIGVPSFVNEIDGLDNFTKNNFNESVKKLEKLGYKIKEISLPNIKYAVPAYYIFLPLKASANLARFDGVRYGLHENGKNGIDDYFKTRGAGFGKEVRRRIIIGTYVLSAGYYDAYYNKGSNCS